MSDNLGNNGGSLNSSHGLAENSGHAVNPQPVNNEQKAGFTVSSQVTVGPIKPVDSGNADSRGDVAKDSLNKSADNGGVRNPMGQFPLRGN